MSAVAALTGDAVSESWELVAASQGGDRAAFAELYTRYRPAIERYVGCRVRQDWAEVEDVVSETFLRALRGIQSVSYQGRDVGAWLIRIARNVVFDRAKSSRVRLADDSGEVPDWAAPTEDGPEELTLGASERAAATARLGELFAAAELCPLQRRCLQLRFGEELTHAQIGARLGCTERASKAIQHRGLEKLRLAARRRDRWTSAAGVWPAPAPWPAPVLLCAGHEVAA
jgi:RNA polymerase sigma-70 factor (ECF subfamily)